MESSTHVVSTSAASVVILIHSRLIVIWYVFMLTQNVQTCLCTLLNALILALSYEKSFLQILCTFPKQALDSILDIFNFNLSPITQTPLNFLHYLFEIF